MILKHYSINMTEEFKLKDLILRNNSEKENLL